MPKKNSIRTKDRHRAAKRKPAPKSNRRQSQKERESNFRGYRGNYQPDPQ